jgi:hypothetical protein
MKREPQSASAAIAMMDELWFLDLDRATKLPWSREAGKLRGVVFAYWQEALRDRNADLMRIERRRRKEQKKRLHWLDAIASTDPLYQSWRLSQVPVPLPSPPPRPVLAGMLAVNGDNRQPVDQLILHIALLHTMVGGRCGISKTGPMAYVLRQVYLLLPDTTPRTRPASEDALIKRAESTRRVWQPLVTQRENYPVSR